MTVGLGDLSAIHRAATGQEESAYENYLCSSEAKTFFADALLSLD